MVSGRLTTINAYAVNDISSLQWIHEDIVSSQVKDYLYKTVTIYRIFAWYYIFYII